MADTQPTGTIDINALMAAADAAAKRNKESIATARRNAETKKLQDKISNMVRFYTKESDTIAKKVANTKAYIEAEVLRQATSGKKNPQALKEYVKSYNALVEKQTKLADVATGLSTGELQVNAKGKIVPTGKVVPKNPKSDNNQIPSSQGKPTVSVDSAGKIITNKGALKEVGGNVQGPKTGTSSVSLDQALATMRANVANIDSPESKATQFADQSSGAFATFAGEQITAWSNQAGENPGMTKWQEIQTILRASGRSKGTTALGFVDNKDIEALKTAFKEAKATGVTISYFLNKDYQYKQATGNLPGSSSGGAVTKTLISSLRLLDSGDASNKLSTAYYKAYGRYPTQKQLTSFKDQWNQEAKIQQAQTASYRSKGMSKDITTGEGFTDLEQSDFLNRYLAKQFKLNFANLSGDTKKIYDDIRSIYRDNMLPEPEFAQVASVVKDLIGTADANVYNTKIAQVKQTVGKQAAAFYPSIEKELLNGDSVETFASIYRSTLSQKWGVSAESLKQDQEAQDLIKSAVNFKGPDNKPRMMDNNEFNALVQSTKRWKASEQAFTSYSNIGDKLISAFNLQGGVR